MAVEDVDESDEAMRVTMSMLLLTTTCSVARVAKLRICNKHCVVETQLRKAIIDSYSHLP